MKNYETVLKVTGMTCAHCAAHVTEELSALAGTEKVTVDLRPEGTSSVSVISSRQPGDQELREAVAEAGSYTITDIIR